MVMESKPSGLMDGLSIEVDDTDAITALEDPRNLADAADDSLKHYALVSHLEGRFDRAKNKRINDEQRWLTCYRDFRGIYGPEVQFTETEKSRAFIKITKTKVLAAYAQIVDILFSGSKFPIGVQPSPIPEGIADVVHFDPAEQQAMQQMGMAQAPAPTGIPTARKDILKLIGLEEKLAPVKDVLKEGAGLSPTSFTWEPAKEAAKKMEKKFQDQLNEANASKSLRSFVFEMCLFGQGVYKGPMVKEKEYAKWSPDGKYEPVIEQIADFEFVSIWDSYPDPDARNIDEAEYFIQRHRMSRSQLRALKKRPYFRAESIEACIKDGYSYIREYWEDELEDNSNLSEIERWEVKEYWGIVDKDFSEIAELKIPEKYKDRDQVQINAWYCNGHLLRLVFNPYTPARIPYHSAPYELNPYSFFGIGLAENMVDTQLLMNGFIRMAVDNAVLTSNFMLEVNETNLVPGQDMKAYPGKIFRTQGQIGQSIHSLKFDNHTQECLAMFDKARQLADESTGMPSYAHGQGGITGIGRTASGMSMLMGAAKENIKSVVRNIDDYLLVPLGKALFAWNMQFEFDKDFIGDLEVIAQGTESLMRNEVRSQKILQFLEMTNNPSDLPFVKRDYLLRELAESLDLEADKVVNDPREAGIQAFKIQELMKAQGIDPMAQQGGGQAPTASSTGAPEPSDPTQTGGGNVAPGAAPTPGEQGFSG